MNASFLLGRLLFGGFFLYSGMNHLRRDAKKSLAQYACSKGVPYPDLAVILSGLAMMLGGASLLTGFRPKLGSAAIGTVLAAVTPTMHDFWNADPAHLQTETIHFSKNVALLGAAFLFFSVEEPWPSSLPAADRTEGSRG